MNTDKEKWIEDVMDSAKGKTAVSANPFLYEKVLFKAQQPSKAERADKAFVYKWAAVILLLVGVNSAIISNALGNKHGGGGMGHSEGIFTEMVTQVSYNY